MALGRNRRPALALGAALVVALALGCELATGVPTSAAPVADEGVSLLARDYHVAPHTAPPSEAAPAGAKGCARLTDRGSHFTVDVEVGTPAQRFSVVADTGSNSLIIPSCLCVKDGFCSARDRCFTGSNRSSTFELYTRGANHHPVEQVITFGSGQIKGVIAKDKVAVGGREVFMEDGLLLMVDQALDLSGPFEGILGLGLPLSELQVGGTTVPPTGIPAEQGQGDIISSDGMQAQDIEDIIKRILGGADVGVGGGSTGDTPDQGPIHMTGKRRLSPNAVAVELRRQMDLKMKQQAMVASSRKPIPQVRSFLEQADVSRFSVCFNDGEDGGILRLGLPEALAPLPSVGREHWGLDFRGISVGASAPTRVQMCSMENMSEGQDTPCGAIPDSGTTFMMGPQEHLDELYETICDGWDRCARNYSALVKAAGAANEAAAASYGFDPFGIQAASKGKVLEYLLGDCQSWLGDAGLDEMPPLKFHLSEPGQGEGEHTLEFSGLDYVVQLTGNSSDEVFCQLAFGPMEYPTQQNGPVWILGLPTFYAYTVTYDTQADPPTVAFAARASTPCGACGQDDVGLLTSKAATHTEGARASRQPRRLQGPPRLPIVDSSRPL